MKHDSESMCYSFFFSTAFGRLAVAVPQAPQTTKGDATKGDCQVDIRLACQAALFAYKGLYKSPMMA